MGKDRRTLSIKELSGAESVTIESERLPQYVIKQPDFSCPLSPQIMWHVGLQYATCPIVDTERDMPECARCKCRGDSKFKAKSNKKPRPRHKKSNVRVEKASNDSTPKIGKTYVSE